MSLQTRQQLIIPLRKNDGGEKMPLSTSRLK